MADGLIPPPSPAGRPDPDAPTASREAPPPEPRGGSRGGLWSGEDEATRTRNAAALAVADPAGASGPALEEAEAVAGARHVASPYKSRFGFLTGALIGVALAAVAAGVLVVAWSSGSTAPSGWSAFAPTADDDVAAARQIAEHVGPHYRLGDGNQLVAVQSGPLEIADVPLSVALRSAPAGGDIELIEGNGLMYTLNGLGPRGSIASGTPSESRHLLLRREALEIALYTFRYRENVDIVVALLPPKPPDPAATPATPAPKPQALFFRPGDLRAELEVPLDRTIAPTTPRPETLPLDSPEARRIDALTRSHLFEATFQQGPDTTAYIVLDRMQR